MFNGSNGGYSLADIAAATAGGNGNGGGFGWGDNGGWWIIIFLLALGGGWGNGWGGGGAGNNGTTAVVGREVSYGFDMNNLENGIRGIRSHLLHCPAVIARFRLSGFIYIRNMYRIIEHFYTRFFVVGQQHTLKAQFL